MWLRAYLNAPGSTAGNFPIRKVRSSGMGSSGIPRRPVTRLEELRQQPVHMQQPLPRQLHAAVLDHQVSRVGEPAEGVAEVRQNVGAELDAEVVRLHPSRLQLQD